MFADQVWGLTVLNISLVLVLLALLLYLVIRKKREIYFQKQFEEVKETIQPAVLNYLLDENFNDNIPLTNRHSLKAVEELFIKYAEALVEEKIKWRIVEYANNHFKKYYEKSLVSRKWSTRMNTLYSIEELKIDSLVPIILKRIAHRKTTESEKIEMLKILATFQHSMCIYYLHHFKFLSDIDYRGILLRLDRPLLDRLFLNYKHSNLQLKYALLDIICLTSDLQYVHIAENVFDHESGEEKVRAYKALLKLGYLQDIKKFINLTQSPVWEERMLTAKLLGDLKENQYLPQLKELLRDSNWWVRTQAGQAINNYPNAKELFEEIIRTEIDLFAKDMALEWLRKGVMKNNVPNYLG